LANQNITVVTGIADPQPLLQYLDNNGFKYEHLSFKDHHSFSDKELKSLKDKPFILTTEKDYTRLYNNLDPGRLYYMPIEMKISDPEKFNTLIKKFVKD
jgi:tetraacyldisaccharide 4'-kinase